MSPWCHYISARQTRINELKGPKYHDISILNIKHYRSSRIRHRPPDPQIDSLIPFFETQNSTHPDIKKMKRNSLPLTHQLDFFPSHRFPRSQKPKLKKPRKGITHQQTQIATKIQFTSQLELPSGHIFEFSSHEALSSG